MKIAFGGFLRSCSGKNCASTRAACTETPHAHTPEASSDVVTPEAAAALLQLIPHAKFVDVADASHMVAGDRNDIFSAAVLEFALPLIE